MENTTIIVEIRMKNRPEIQSTLPLRFMVYHFVRKEFYKVIQIHDGFPVIVSKEVNGNEVQEFLDVGHAKHIQVVQAVGLTDKNGIHVYDGDIILSDVGEIPGRPAIVAFDQGIFYAVCMQEGDKDATMITLEDYHAACGGEFWVEDHILNASDREDEEVRDERDPDS